MAHIDVLPAASAASDGALSPVPAHERGDCAAPQLAPAERPIFHLRGKAMSYVVGVTRYGHLEHMHFGPALGDLASAEDLTAIRTKTPAVTQGVAYAPGDDSYNLDYLPLDWSGLGKGDYRGPATEFRHTDGTFVSDFRYVGHEITAGVVPPAGGLPGAHASDDAATTLRIDLADGEAELSLYYTVIPAADTIVRRAVLTNASEAHDDSIVIRSLMSQQVDLPDRGYDLVTFDGTWIAEGHRHVRPVMPGTYVNESLTGTSSSQHNPGVLLATRGATETHGEVWAFNLIYSGNHSTSVELSRRDLVRVRSGINPTGFEWTLGPGESFETPEATLTYSNRGFTGASEALHRFVGDHVVRGEWAKKERPVLVNNWEATFFDINHRTVVSMAKRAKKLGAELFVLDDGWFGARNDDFRGLGDWHVNLKKLPRGLKGLGEDVRALGLDFGIWVEPEMINRDSDLYRAHPDWAIAVPGRTPSEGRHQLVLDLARADVRDHLVRVIGTAIDDAGATYVKWDCNRNLSDLWSSVCAPGEVAHRFVLGLYDILRRIFEPRPHILLESCASGGNRFDLGMMCFSPQIWTSDCTDPVERLDIQLGLSHLYPQSTMGAHVTASPSVQTLRATPLGTRFNVAALGLLGYELDVRRLDPAELREARAQVEFYKKHRRLLQFGTMRRHEDVSAEHVTVSISDDEADRHVVGHYQLRARAARPPEKLPLPPLRAERRYRVTSRPQSIDLRDFGALLEHVLPLPVRGDGRLVWEASRHYRRPDGEETYEATGAALAGLRLAPQFEGTGAHPGDRLLGEHGSRLYVVEPAES